jgi:hypothetical protein
VCVECGVFWCSLLLLLLLPLLLERRMSRDLDTFANVSLKISHRSNPLQVLGLATS